MSPMFQPIENVSSSRLDLYNLVSFHPEATFFAKYEGQDLEDLSINTGDILVIDRSIKAKIGSLVVAFVDSEFILTTLKKQKEIEIWGVVNHVIRKV